MEPSFSSECAKKTEHPFTEIIESSGLAPIGEGLLVEFRLLYQGKLRANGGAEDKFLIRRQIHPQLRRLWVEHPVLRDQCERMGAQHLLPTAQASYDAAIKELAENHINGFTFLPLARTRFFLRCSLDVLFLRREKPGKVFMGGDIDNRLKTLFDALKMPTLKQDFGNESPGSDEDPFFVLLEDDQMIADVSVTTDRLLELPPAHEHSKDYAVLVINVKLQTTQRAEWWHVFS